MSDDIFGRDILFTDDFVTTTSGDYVTVGGEANLNRAIYRRLLTRPGGFKFRPEYGAGVQDWVKKRMTTSERNALRQRIIEQLAQEKRIDDVVEVLVEQQSNPALIVVRVKIKTAGRELRFQPFEFSEEAA